MSRVLVIDDEPSICWSFDQALGDAGHEVRVASTAESALADLRTFEPEVVLLDVRLPGMDGLTALRELRKAASAAPVILMTAYGSLDLAVQALNQGAFDYLPKPFDLDDAVEIVRRALASRNCVHPSTPEPGPQPQELLGVSRVMQEIFRQIALVAPLNVPVLITGESGVGKELVARAIHRYSQRDPLRFVPVCVPALSPSVLESELFGHVQGAFTGAERDRPGLLDQAHGGTAFFDEIGEIPLQQQVKLLRVLDDRQIIPVGGNQPHPSEFRLIAATNRSLDDLVARGEFRDDLLYRLSIFRIHLPPLRERREDIPVLARLFLDQVSGDRQLTLTDESIAELQSRRWPGNVRELRSAVQHAAVVCRGHLVTPECLPAPRRAIDPVNDDTSLLRLLQKWAELQMDHIDPLNIETTLYERFLNQFEPIILETALRTAGGNRKLAAELLGLHRETLRKRLRKHGIEED